MLQGALVNWKFETRGLHDETNYRFETLKHNLFKESRLNETIIDRRVVLKRLGNHSNSFSGWPKIFPGAAYGLLEIHGKRK